MNEVKIFRRNSLELNTCRRHFHDSLLAVTGHNGPREHANHGNVCPHGPIVEVISQVARAIWRGC